MRLVYTATQQPVKPGDTVTLRDGVEHVVGYFRQPHKPDSEGKVVLRLPSDIEPAGREFYVSVIGAEWIEREDRRPSPTGEDVWPPEDPPADFDPENPNPDDDAEQREAMKRERDREDGPQ